MRKLFIGFGLLLVSAFSQATDLNWQAVEQKAKGQTVYFYAWGGSPEINNYLRWADKRLNSEYGVRLKHVKVGDIAEAITRLAAEKTAGKNNNGSVDMVWVNGENFKSMKRYDLITDSFATQLPNWRYVDETFPVDSDLSEPTLGLEAPWGVGQLVFIYDNENIKDPPRSFNTMLDYENKYTKKVS